MKILQYNSNYERIKLIICFIRFWNIAKLVRPSFLVRIFKGSNPFIPKFKFCCIYLTILTISICIIKLIVKDSIRYQ